MTTLNWLFEHKNDIYEMSVEIIAWEGFAGLNGISYYVHTLSVNGIIKYNWAWRRTFHPVITKAKAEHELKGLL